MSECDREASIMRMPWPTRGCCATKNTFNDRFFYKNVCQHTCLIGVYSSLILVLTLVVKPYMNRGDKYLM